MLEFSWTHILILVVAGLFILGPERLPQAAAWLGKTVRQVREFVSGAQQQLRDEMGDEFEEFRKPLQDLRELRSFDPRRALTAHLFDGDTDPLDLTGTGITPATNGHTAPRDRLAPGQPPPTDPDAT
ncbi:Sec-independent protein translocase subunit TatB [Amycolatopsis sp. K13G38]|uniref:Sec-independent protein translocase protein TatB n=1 Tax=Amycolatopsis acididurans TaxID=2724524 RepID=A0ABX1JI86_9PSEU|nr:Sec-independent protein translocase protein TatB [Amycolatopsis acididurans]NKQ58550.1 Sec-independent protein translocase subunit TatB [Amycolatopsis acididurans]